MNFNENDKIFMNMAFEWAHKGALLDEVPVGALLVKNNTIVCGAHNLKETNNNPLLHAEIVCIHEAVTKEHNWRLSEYTLYVTLEPCTMCAGAIIQARIPRVVFATPDSKTGAFGGLYNLNELQLNHKPKIESGLLQKECSQLIKNFFKDKRAK